MPEIDLGIILAPDIHANRPVASTTSKGALYPCTTHSLIYRNNGTTWDTIGSNVAGTVTSVALALPAELTVSGSPVTSSGTLTGAWANETANTVFSGATSGGAATPAFRALVAADIPNLAASKITSGTLAIAQGGTNAATANANLAFAGPTSGGAAAPSFRALVAADIPALGSAGTYKSVTTDAGGRVSAGTSMTGVSTEVLYSANSIQTVTNTTTETTLLPATYAMAGGLLNLRGRTLWVHAGGYFSTDPSTAHTMEHRLKFGSTVVIDTGASSPGKNFTNRVWTADYYIVCQTTGASGVVWVSGGITTWNATGAYGSPLMLSVNAPQTGITVDLTASQTIDYMHTWGTGVTASDTWTLTQYSVMLLN